MPDADAPTPSQLRQPLAQRLAFLLRAARSGARRYGASLPASIVNRAGKLRIVPADAPHFAQAWSDLVDHPGLVAFAWLGHCSVLLRLGGLTILTDPVLGQRIGMALGGLTFGPQRLTPAPLRVSQLPPVDVVLISHAHFDHLDRPTLTAIARRDGRQALVLTAAQTARLIPRGFSAVHEVQWDQTVHLSSPQSKGELTLTAVKPRHWGARNAWDRHRGYNSYLLQQRSSHGVVPRSRVLFAGDTADTSAFDGLGPLELAIMGIGAYDPWEHAHATPEQVWDMVRRMDAESVLPVHYGTFELGDEGHDEPLSRLVVAAGAAVGRVIPAAPGEIIRWSTRT